MSTVVRGNRGETAAPRQPALADAEAGGVGWSVVLSDPSFTRVKRKENRPIRAMTGEVQPVRIPRCVATVVASSRAEAKEEPRCD